MTNQDYVSNLVDLLLEKTGSIFGTVRLKMTAKEQRALFGQYLGKGLIIVDGESETVTHRVKVCFGNDWEDTERLQWKDL